jgi:hypothetical protein
VKIFRSGALSEAEADELIADVWKILEEYQIPSPRLVCLANARGEICVDLSFRDRIDGALVVNLLNGRRGCHGQGMPIYSVGPS